MVPQFVLKLSHPQGRVGNLHHLGTNQFHLGTMILWAGVMQFRKPLSLPWLCALLHAGLWVMWGTAPRLTRVELEPQHAPLTGHRIDRSMWSRN